MLGPGIVEDGAQAVHQDVEIELQKVLHVPLPDAVVDPRAVVVHAQDARVADGAVVHLQGGFELGCWRGCEGPLRNAFRSLSH